MRIESPLPRQYETGLELIGVRESAPVSHARPSRRNQIIVLCGLVWTGFVVLALWWMLRADRGPSVYVVHGGDATPHATFEKFRAWSKGGLGIQRIYPWVLFGPYVAWFALCFPLERGRLRLSLPLNLAACAAFVTASHIIGERTSVRSETVVFLRTGPEVEGTNRDSGTNAPEDVGVQSGTMRVTTGGFAGGEVGLIGAPEQLRPGTQWENVQKFQNVSGAALSNLLVQLHPGSKGGRPTMPPPGLPRPGLLSMLLDLLAYGAVLGLSHSVYFYRRFREREHQALFLESNLAQARLNTLRAQLQPHFLFNSLNAIATLLRRDPRLAESTLLSLSELLRLALNQSQHQEVSLREEMNLVQHYLEIQRTRFGEKLRIELQIDPTALDCLVPTLLLQPVVENAIRHGIEPADKPGLVRLQAHRAENRLVLNVVDNGVGLSGPGPSNARNDANDVNHSTLAMTSGSRLSKAQAGTGIGLANLRARLEALYGSQHKLQLETPEQGGVSVRIEIPWRPAACSENETNR